jgi:protein-L-isoaspartate(D-aspartate) O-methyltransferase
VTFRNDTQGRPTNLLQGLALDGRAVKRIKLSASVKVADVKAGFDRDELPAVTIRFYDDQRSLLGTQWLGTFRGTRAWRLESQVFRVPAECREAIVSIGLFGATGEASFDNIRLEAVGL